MANRMSFYTPHYAAHENAPPSSASASTSRFSMASTSSSSNNPLSPPSAASSLPSQTTKRFSSLTISGGGAGASPGAGNAIPAQTVTPILDRNLGKTRGQEIAFGAWAFLFSEIVQYTQKRVSGIAEFEQRLSTIGYRVGVRLVELLPLRDSLPASTSRNSAGPPRQTRLLPVLHYVHTTLYRYLFGKPASSLERSTENEDEYMIGDDEPVLDKGVQIPKEMSTLSTNALLAGLIEAVMDGLGFPSRVTSHLIPTDQFPRRTVILIKLNKNVMQREQALASAK